MSDEISFDELYQAAQEQEALPAEENDVFLSDPDAEEIERAEVSNTEPALDTDQLKTDNEQMKMRLEASEKWRQDALKLITQNINQQHAAAGMNNPQLQRLMQENPAQYAEVVRRQAMDSVNQQVAEQAILKRIPDKISGYAAV